MPAAPSRQGTVDELFYDPRHPYTLGLLQLDAAMSRARHDRLNPINGTPPNIEHLPSGCAFHPRCAFRFERCFVDVPQLVEFGEGSRKKACHYSGKLVAEENAA